MSSGHFLATSLEGDPKIKLQPQNFITMSCDLWSKKKRSPYFFDIDEVASSTSLWRSPPNRDDRMFFLEGSFQTKLRLWNLITITNDLQILSFYWCIILMKLSPLYFYKYLFPSGLLLIRIHMEGGTMTKPLPQKHIKTAYEYTTSIFSRNHGSYGL